MKKNTNSESEPLNIACVRLSEYESLSKKELSDTHELMQRRLIRMEGVEYIDGYAKSRLQKSIRLAHDVFYGIHLTVGYINPLTTNGFGH